MKRVSIIIPCFNAGDLLCEAVESALAQSHADIEIIIVDDGSTDPRTQEILEAATWPRTRIIRKENAGPASARNIAIGQSRGEYILPLDADDTIEPTYVEKALAVMESSPNVGIVYCKAMRFGAEQGPWGLPPYNLRELVIDNVIFVTSMFRRSDWLAVGGFNESLRMGVEDYEFWVKIVGKGRDVVQLDEYLFNYRIQESSRTTSFSADRSVVVDTYARIFRDNIDFFARHAEFLFEHRFGLYDELARYRARYGKLDAFLSRHSVIRRLAKGVVDVFGIGR
ncbi:glycosyltransferase family 2 protein [Stenotrophomonas sp. ATCM1_4]|uniref:glycosyltransferase family 2 protein n=1 Tax=Stenotrophomonas sp. ATCM1_4 TaxID=2259330 RepID=UPI00105166E5|nr:glycosyltransferase family A protein [Stenotrophomonas sp. ATCM1_4]TDB29242.1 glycosyltransferase family 2 protein [Stenotrophomonas sp. ATCM1_4]